MPRRPASERRVVELGSQDRATLGRAYRQLGNAVAPPPVRDIARALLVSLGIVPREDALR